MSLLNSCEKQRGGSWCKCQWTQWLQGWSLNPLLLSPFRIFPKTLVLHPRPPPSLSALRVSMLFKVHWMQWWDSKHLSPRSQHSFSVCYKAFLSVNASPDWAVYFLHISPVLKWKNIAEEKQAIPQSLPISCTLSLKYPILAIQLIYAQRYSLRYLWKAEFESFMAISFHGCVLVMYLQ